MGVECGIMLIIKTANKEEGIEIGNPSPFLVTILKMKKQREEMARIRAQRTLRNEGKLDSKTGGALRNGIK